MKIHSVGAEFFHADRRTDMKLIFAFRNITNATKNHVCRFRSSFRIRDQLFDIFILWNSSGSAAEWPDIMHNLNEPMAV